MGNTINYKKNYSFNKNLVNPNTNLIDKYKIILKYEDDQYSGLVDDYLTLGRSVYTWCPYLRDCNEKDIQTLVNQAEKEAFENDRKIYEILEQISKKYDEKHDGEQFPKISDIKKDWALFIWFRIGLIADVDIFRRHRSKNQNIPNKEKRKNEIIDLEYLFFACLFGALASKDDGMRYRFRRLRPDGVLFPSDNESAFIGSSNNQ